MLCELCASWSRKLQDEIIGNVRFTAFFLLGSWIPSCSSLLLLALQGLKHMFMCHNSSVYVVLAGGQKHKLCHYYEMVVVLLWMFFFFWPHDAQSLALFQKHCALVLTNKLPIARASAVGHILCFWLMHVSPPVVHFTAHSLPVCYRAHICVLCSFFLGL